MEEIQVETSANYLPIDDARYRSIKAGTRLANVSPGEEVVISGISGRFPDSNDIYEFRDNLYNKVNMCTDDTRRWNHQHPDVPKESGKLYDIEKFDAGFFGIHYRQANVMDPMGRIVMETVCEAIMDAGLNPEDLRGKNINTYLALSFSDTERHFLLKDLIPKAFPLTGCIRASITSRISYWLGLKGSTTVTDTACSSTMHAIDHAYKDIREGRCEAAIITAAHLCMSPFTTLQFKRLGVLSPDGKCKSFDDAANGYVRSETIGVLFLQKAKDSKRIYAQIVHAKANCDGFKDMGITYPSGKMQEQLYEEIYEECKIDPSTLSYFEAHGTGTDVGDPEELNGIAGVFCKNRDTPLLIGSVRSNCGHSEPASALCSVAKVILIMENECLLPNLHYETPRQNVKALVEGKMVVVTEPTPWNAAGSGLIAINSFGFGGGNCHLLLKCNSKTKNRARNDDLNRLVCVSGRTEEAVTFLLNDLKQRTLDVEFVALLHNIFRLNVPGHNYRGWSIVSNDGEVSRSTKYIGGGTKAIWYVFGDFESKDWVNILRNLCSLPTFRKTIQRIDHTLASTDIQIENILTSADHNVPKNPMLTSITMVALQIAVVEMLSHLGIVSDQVVGQGISECICGYVDGCLSFEQTIWIAYYRSLAAKELLDARNVKDIAVRLNANIKQVVPEPKQRTAKWISPDTCAPQHWNKILTGFASAEYFTNNFLYPISIENVGSTIPREAILINYCGRSSMIKVPCGTFTDISIVNLCIENQELDTFLISLGSLYNAGANLQLKKLYPEVVFPVSRGTPMISPLIKWNHTKDWFTFKPDPKVKELVSFGRTDNAINVQLDRFQYLAGHVVDGRNLFPATAYLELVWKTLEINNSYDGTTSKVVFENIRFLRATNIPAKGSFKLDCQLQLNGGNFEVSESGTTVVSGRVYLVENLTQVEAVHPSICDTKPTVDFEVLQERDIYKELRLRGYEYTGVFRSIKEYNLATNCAKMKWCNNWAAFMDNMLQIKLLSVDTRDLYVPTSIDYISIDPAKHMESIKETESGSEVAASHCKASGLLSAGGIEIFGMQANVIARKRPMSDPVLEMYKFVPNVTTCRNLEQSIKICMQIALENFYTSNVYGVEVIDQPTSVGVEPLAPFIVKAIENQPLIKADIKILSKFSYPSLLNIVVEDKQLLTETDCYLVVATNILSRPQVQEIAFGVLKNGGYILSRESRSTNTKNCLLTDGEILIEHYINDEMILLLRKTVAPKPRRSICIETYQKDKFKWLNELQNAMLNKQHHYLFSQNDPISGILGLFNCLMREPGGDLGRCVFIKDESAPTFDQNAEFYKNQLSKDMVTNVYENGSWGTYRHLTLNESKSMRNEHRYIIVTTRGDLSSLKWYAGPLHTKADIEPGHTLVHICYAPLNFRDVMLASGKLPTNLTDTSQNVTDFGIGIEFAGITSSGKRVMGICNDQALATLIAADSILMCDIPDDWNMEEAATVPVVYCTVLYALLDIGKLERGSSILIHAGSGGVGQAAINVALHYGCNIFTTVGTQEKRDFIRKQYPQIPDEHIGNSRDTSFEQMIMRETNRRGVDYVLNSLAEEKLQASVRCLATNGKFLEIGKFDITKNNPLNLDKFVKEVSFHGIMLNSFINTDVTKRAVLMDTLKEGIASGAVRPLTRTVFQDDEVEQAFRYMASGKHIGKVIIKVADPNDVTDQQNLCKDTISEVVQRYYCTPSKTYIVVGGLGGFGLELAYWLVVRGATNLVLSSRKGLKNGYQSFRIDSWTKNGVMVKISTADITTKEGCVKLCEEANAMGPVEGIFNLAVVLKDSICENQTVESFQESFGPKAVATMHLDEVSRVLCPELRNFVVFSSVTCGRGNAGQTNYGMANSIMERICENRRQEGLPAVAIQWGAIGDVGLVADMQESNREVIIGGTLQQRLSSCLSVLDTFICQEATIVSSMVVAEKKSACRGDNIIESVASILGIANIKIISAYSTLPELGMDSMMAVEIKQMLERDYSVFLAPQDMRSLTINKLQLLMDEKETAEKSEVDLTLANHLIYRVIGLEELTEIPVVRMKTLCTTNTVDAKTVILIPGIEGFAAATESLCSSLDANIFCLQMCADLQYETIEELAKLLLVHVHKILKTSNEFTIIAYSFGTMIALWLSSFLEAEGRNGTLIMVDGSPDIITEFVKFNFPASNETELQIYALCYLMSNYVPVSIVEKYKDDLEKCKTNDERIEFVIERTPREFKYSAKYQKSLHLSFFKRLECILKFTPPANKVNSPIKLFKAKQPVVTNVAEDYGLGKYGNNLVVESFEGDHITILENPLMAKAINDVITTDVVFIEESILREKSNNLTSLVRPILEL